jgi:hypothetical protein
MSNVYCGSFDEIWSLAEIGDFISHGSSFVVRCKQSDSDQLKEDIRYYIGRDFSEHYTREFIEDNRLWDDGFIILTHKVKHNG